MIRFNHRETLVERYLYDEVRKRGGWSIKLYPISMVGLPDRMVLMPGRRVYFVELKRASGGRQRAAQQRWRERLRAMHFCCEFVSGKDGVDSFIQTVIDCKSPPATETEL